MPPEGTGDRPLISVIVPAFNAARFLPETLASIQAQAYHPLEILVVNDGSTDETDSLLKAWSHVRIICQSHAGPSVARNAGVAAAHGDLLAFLDADDRWTLDKLQVQVAYMQQHPHVQLVAGLVEEFDDRTLTIPTPRSPRLATSRAYTVGALLVRRTDFLQVGFFNPDLRVGEFIDWRSRALASGLCEHVLDHVVLQRRIHDQNTTRQHAHMPEDYLKVLCAHLARTQPPQTPMPTPRVAEVRGHDPSAQ